jgi:hypothetical protein
MSPAPFAPLFHALLETMGHVRRTAILLGVSHQWVSERLAREGLDELARVLRWVTEPTPEASRRRAGATKRRRAARLRASGLCACGRQPVPGRTKCKTCNARKSKANTKRAERLTARGSCRRCALLPRSGAKRHCDPCLAYLRDGAARRRRQRRARTPS